MALVSLMVVALIAYRGQFSVYVTLAMVVANAPDIFGQIIPGLLGKRKETRYGHSVEIIKNPYLEFGLHQLLTLSGFLFILFYR